MHDQPKDDAWFRKMDDALCRSLSSQMPRLRRFMSDRLFQVENSLMLRAAGERDCGTELSVVEALDEMAAEFRKVQEVVATIHMLHVYLEHGHNPLKREPYQGVIFMGDLP
jgi:hypothetical protein